MKVLGTITSIKDNIITCNEQENSKSFVGELVEFNDKGKQELTTQGVIFELNSNTLQIVLIKGTQESLFIGNRIYSTGKTLEVKVGYSLLGKTVDPFGKVLYDTTEEEGIENVKYLDKLFHTEYIKMETKSPSIIDRKKVAKPFFTGITCVDCMFPIGLGQRQLILGDNNTGKTSLALSSIINQKRFNDKGREYFMLYQKVNYMIPCIYVSIGQKRSEVVRIQQVLKDFESS